MATLVAIQRNLFINALCGEPDEVEDFLPRDSASGGLEKEVEHLIQEEEQAVGDLTLMLRHSRL